MLVLSDQAQSKLREKSYDTAQEMAKQVISLSTVVLTFTATFLKDILPAGIKLAQHRWLLGLSWSSLIVAVLSALFCLGALAYSQDTESPDGIQGTHPRLAMTVAAVAMVIGLAAFADFVWVNLYLRTQ